MSKQNRAVGCFLVAGAVASIATEPAPTGWDLDASTTIPAGTLASSDTDHRYLIDVELTGTEPALFGTLYVDLDYELLSDPVAGSVPLQITLSRGSTIVFDEAVSASARGILQELSRNADLWTTCTAFPCVETYELKLARTDGSTLPFSFSGTVEVSASGGPGDREVPVPDGTELHVTVTDATATP